MNYHIPPRKEDEARMYPWRLKSPEFREELAKERLAESAQAAQEESNRREASRQMYEAMGPDYDDSGVM